MFYLTTHITHFIYGYMINVYSDNEKKEEMLNLTTHSIHFIYEYMIKVYSE